MTFEQIKKAQKFADYLSTVFKAWDFVDLDLALKMFDMVNGIEEDNEDEAKCENDTLCGNTQFTSDKYKWDLTGEVDFHKCLVINCCNCDCK